VRQINTQLTTEIIMIVIALAVAAVTVFALPALLAMVCVSVRSEDRRQLPQQAPTRLARCVRCLVGLRVGQSTAAPSGRPRISSRRPA
jgi:hypothetical protein